MLGLGQESGQKYPFLHQNHIHFMASLGVVLAAWTEDRKHL